MIVMLQLAPVVLVSFVAVPEFRSHATVGSSVQEPTENQS